MAQVGCLGDIVFQVSSEMIKTINNVMWSGAARYAEHKRHLGSTLTEFTGLELDTLSFDLELSIYLGVDPLADIDKIWDYERAGKVLSLVIGDKAVGKYKWTIKSHKVKPKTYDGRGNIIAATVSVDLIEYQK